MVEIMINLRYPTLRNFSLKKNSFGLSKKNKKNKKIFFVPSRNMDLEAIENLQRLKNG